MNNSIIGGSKISANEQLKLVFFTLLSVCFVYVYSARVPSGDLLAYSNLFYTYTTFNDLINAPIFIIVEPVLYLFFILFNLLGLSFKVFVGFIISLNLWFSYKILRNFYSKNLALFGLLTFMLIPINMSLSLQILRQYLSMQIMFFFLTSRNNNYLLFLISVLLHTSSLIFFPLIFVKERIRPIYIILAAVFLLAIYFSPVYTYLSYKLAKGSYYSFEVTGFTPYLITGIPLALVFFSKKYNQIFKYIILYLFLIIVFALNGEMQFRYMVGIYILFPIIIVDIFSKFEIRIQRVVKPLFLLFLLFWTVYYILFGPYEYLL